MDTKSSAYACYREFLEYFAENVDPTDQLPVRVPNFTLNESEITGAVTDWIIQYLNDKNCPQTLVAPIVRLALEQTHQTLKKSPEQYGYSANSDEYQQLKLMQLSISKTNDVCQSLLDNLQLDALIPSPPIDAERPPLYSARAVKNTRRHMEDRHIIIDDFNTLFGIKDTDRTSYYGIFDGHGGTEAAAYSVAHLHCEIAASPYYPSSPAEALREAFLKTDYKFIEKSKKLSMVAGTTALCALYRPVEQCLYVGWVGDSKAMLVSQNRMMQIVNPHKPDNADERSRIEESGGCVLTMSGCSRVNGRLAISRAIGDYGLKDVVIGDPDIVIIPLSGKEDFLLMACDGLWDFVDENEAAAMVYEMLKRNEGDTQPIASQLIELAKRGNSSDNISVVVVFFKDPKQIVAEHEAMDYESTNGHQLADANVHHGGEIGGAGIAPTPLSLDSHFGSDLDDFKMHVDAIKHEALHEHQTQSHPDFLFGTGGGENGGADYHSNVVTTIKTEIETTTTSNGNGKLLADEFGEDDEQHDDFGPETDVDATDDAAISPLSPIDQTSDILTYNELNANAANNFSAGYDFIEKAAENPIGIVSAVVHENEEFGVEELVKKDTDDVVGGDHVHAHVDLHSHHQFDDNRFMEDVAAHGVSGLIDAAVHAAHDDDDVEPELRNKLDFSEKKEYSFEREDFEKELNTVGDISAELLAISKEVIAAASNEKEQNEYERDDEDDEDDDDEHDIAHLPPNLEAAVGEIVTMAEQHVLPTNDQVPIESVIVAESGDDSDDEWNYIKVDKSATKSDKESPEFDREEEAEASKPVQEDSITSSTPPTASIGEPDIVVSQDIEGTYTDLHEEKQEPEREHFGFEKSAENLSEAIDSDQEYRAEQQHLDVDVHEDDDDMDKQLNPEAAEFVPTSPPASAPLSPFANGSAAIGNRPDLLEDDLLAQSPRKNVAPVMEDFTLPSENDFSEISKRPSELLPTSPTGLNGANGDAEHRPSSSSSQCSYQEMNLKEAMHGDEKQEFADEVSEARNFHVETTVNELDLLQDHVADATIRLLRDQDPMHMSYYNDRNENGLPQTNPFAEPEVDMNAVQPLPDSDDEAFNEREDFDVIVSSPAGLNNQYEEQPAATEAETAFEVNAGVPLTSAVDHVYTENQEISLAEDDLINVSETSPITQVVQEMATEVTSILNEIDEHHQNTEQLVDDRHIEFDTRDIVADGLNKSGLSPEASEFNPSQLQTETVQAPIEEEKPVSIVDPVDVAPQQEEPQVELLAAAGIATATAIAAAVASIKSPAQTKEPKVTAATKKPSTVPAKKSLTAPLKSTLKPAASTARTSATSPSKALASKATTAAPKPAVRTVKAPIEKKSATTLAAKKPITNGVATTTVKKTTTTTTATRSAVGAPKPAVHTTKTTTLRTTSATSSAAPAKTSTLSKPATSTTTARVPLSARTTAKPAASTTAAAKPKTTSVLKTSSAPAAISRTLLNKPKPTADKPATSTLAPRTSASAALKATSPAKPATTTITRKIDSARSPLSKVATKTTTSRLGGTTTTTTTTTAKRPASASTLTTTTRTTTATAAKRLTPIKKTTTTTVTKASPSPNGPLKKTVTKTTVASTQLVTGNGDICTGSNGISNETAAIIDAVCDQVNGMHVGNGDAISTVTTFTANKELIANGDNNPVIDTSAD